MCSEYTHDVIRDYMVQNGQEIKFIALDDGNTRQSHHHAWKKTFSDNYYLYDSKRYNSPYSVVTPFEVINIYTLRYKHKLITMFSGEKVTEENVEAMLTKDVMDMVIPLMLSLFKATNIKKYNNNYLLEHAHTYDCYLTHYYFNNPKITETDIYKNNERRIVCNIINIMISILKLKRNELFEWIEQNNKFILFLPWC